MTGKCVLNFLDEIMKQFIHKQLRALNCDHLFKAPPNNIQNFVLLNRQTKLYAVNSLFQNFKAINASFIESIK